MFVCYYRSCAVISKKYICITKQFTVILISLKIFLIYLYQCRAKLNTLRLGKITKDKSILLYNITKTIHISFTVTR